jgi:hypothetical protein
LLKNGRRIRKSNRESEYNQSTLYAYMEISKSNPFVQLIHSNFLNGELLATTKNTAFEPCYGT